LFFYSKLRICELTVALLIGTELALLYLIRDNLPLNVIKLIQPVEWIQQLQAVVLGKTEPEKDQEQFGGAGASRCCNTGSAFTHSSGQSAGQSR
jgi:hypothetical protein